MLIRRPARPAWPFHREKEMEDVQNEHLRNIAINAHIDHRADTLRGSFDRNARRKHPQGVRHIRKAAKPPTAVQ